MSRRQIGESRDEFLARTRAENNAYHDAHREQIREQNRLAAHRYRASNPEAYKQAQKRYRQAHPERLREQKARSRQQLRGQILDRYGRVCACCGETTPEFLALDHIDGGGCEHRRQIGQKGGMVFYHWLRHQGFPDGYQTLCHNCNHAKSHYGCCPHQRSA